MWEKSKVSDGNDYVNYLNNNIFLNCEYLVHTCSIISIKNYVS